MISFALPRFCDQQLSRSRKQVHYAGAPNWVAKLDTIVHELYHIDPERRASAAWRRPTEPTPPIATAASSSRTSSRWSTSTWRPSPIRRSYEFLEYDFEELTARYGGVVGTTFRSFPSYPQRYTEVLQPQPAAPERT